MNKPITVAYNDFMKDMVTLINSSNLPAFVIYDALEKLENEIQPTIERQYKSDLKMWEENQQEELNIQYEDIVQEADE